jgi:glycosyltransferase involved in cell wall biosynthesis
MSLRVAVVIPAFRVRAQVLDVIRTVGPECDRIFVVDDKCPEESGAFVEANAEDPRVQVIYHDANKGVGGAVMTGYRAALDEGADVIVKVDGDGQMDPGLIPRFVAPLARGTADYTKGNRFYSLHFVRQMPRFRLFGNAVLSFLTKMSSWYWHVFDPTNGFTAIHRSALRRINLFSVSERYFFESDMLIRLGDIRAVVADVPMEAVYGEESSNLKIHRIIGIFLRRHARSILRRIVYSYFLRDFNLASINLVVGIALLIFGGIFGGIEWWRSIDTGVPATTGTVMISVLPIILGFQLILFFFGYDIAAEPTRPIQSLDVGEEGFGSFDGGDPAPRG